MGDMEGYNALQSIIFSDHVINPLPKQAKTPPSSTGC